MRSETLDQQPTGAAFSSDATHSCQSVSSCRRRSHVLVLPPSRARACPGSGPTIASSGAPRLRRLRTKLESPATASLASGAGISRASPRDRGVCSNRQTPLGTSGSLRCSIMTCLPTKRAPSLHRWELARWSLGTGSRSSHLPTTTSGFSAAVRRLVAATRRAAATGLRGGVMEVGIRISTTLQAAGGGSARANQMPTLGDDPVRPRTPAHSPGDFSDPGRCGRYSTGAPGDRRRRARPLVGFRRQPLRRRRPHEVLGSRDRPAPGG